MSVYRIEFKKAAVKYLKSLEKKTQVRIMNAIRGLDHEPPTGDIKPLEGRHGKWRLRVGGYRVIYSRNETGDVVIVLIEDIGSRGDVYK